MKRSGTESGVASEDKYARDTYDASVLFDSINTNLSWGQNERPRSISVGPKGSVRMYNGGEDPRDGPGVAWDGPVEHHVLQGGNCDVGNVEYYQDFMKTFSDGVRVHVIHSMQRGGREENSWSTHGERCPIQSDELEDIEDSIRKVAEGSNRVDGFLYFVEDTSVWGHVSKYLIEDGQEEYRGRSTYLFATRPDTGLHEKSTDARHSLLHGLAISQLSQIVDLYVPMHDSLGYLKRSQSQSHLYQTSLSNAMGIFGASMPFFKKQGRVEMHRVASHLTGRHHCPIVSLEMIFPTLNNKSVCFTDQSIRYGDDRNRIADFISYLQHDGTLQVGDDMFQRTMSSSSSCGLPILPPMSQLVPGIPSRNTQLPMISVLGSTRSFAGTLDSTRNALLKNASSPLLESWGVSKEDIMESAEILETMADAIRTS